MKAVLISIKPKYCELIANGKKTVEVRKTMPKLDLPFKCYIYCTKVNHGWFNFAQKTRLDGKVIGEFQCDKIEDFLCYDYVTPQMYSIGRKACLTPNELIQYVASATGYAWHITNLVIYDNPKELGEFKPIECEKNIDGECVYKGRCKHQVKCSTWGYRTFKCEKKITIAPQSWRFVEELGV